MRAPGVSVVARRSCWFHRLGQWWSNRAGFGAVRGIDKIEAVGSARSERTSLRRCMPVHRVALNTSPGVYQILAKKTALVLRHEALNILLGFAV